VLPDDERREGSRPRANRSRHAKETAISTTEPTDLVPIDELTELEKAYYKRVELDAGSVHRRTLDERRRAAEGRALSGLRAAGQPLNVRAVVDRPGEPHMMTTSVATAIELDRSRP